MAISILFSALGLSNIVRAADFTINSAQTTENGGNILDGSDTITVTETGSISITSNANGIASTNGSNAVTVNGEITTSGGSGRWGIEHVGNNNITVLNGSIKTTGTTGWAIGNQGDYNTTTISGDISTDGSQSYGAFNLGSNNTTILSGGITTLNTAAHGIQNQGNENTLTVSGKITTSGANAYGVYIVGNDNNTTVTGNVTSNNSRGIVAFGSNNIVDISGTVRSGFVTAIGPNSFTLQEGAIVTGDMMQMSGAPTLNIDVGAAPSYRYTTIGSWTVNDLDGRAFTNTNNVVSSLGTGNSETAGDMLFERNRSLLASLDQHIEAPTDRTEGSNSVWMDMFSGGFDRSQGSTNPASVAFASDISGLTIGMPITSGARPFDLVLSRAETDLNIASGQQKLNVTSVKIGAFFKDLSQAKGWDVAASAMIGRNQYEGLRDKFLDNTTATGYGASLSSDYSSSEIMLGLTGKHSSIINPKMQFDGKLHGSLTRESIKSYQEGSNFSWKDRTLVQATAGASATLVFVPKPNLQTYIKLGATRRALMGGRQASYSIDIATITSATGNNFESYYIGELGFSYESANAVNITASLERHSTISNDSGTTAHIGLNWAF